MGCVITIFKPSPEIHEIQRDKKQYVSFKNEDEIYEYTPPNPFKPVSTTDNDVNKDDLTNKLNISSVSGINVTELLSLHNSFQLNPDSSVIYDEEDADLIETLQNELNLDKHSSPFNVSFSFM